MGEDVIEPRSSEILPNDLRGTVEILLYAVLTGGLGVRRVRRRDRPQIHQPQLLHNGHGIRARLRIGDKGNGGLVQGLAEPLVVGEKEGFVLLDWAADGGAELVSFEGRSRRAGIEEVARVERVISQKLVHRA